MKSKYQMTTVCEYLKLLDEKSFVILNDEEQKIRSGVEKYLLSIRRANKNAQILEVLLA